MSLFKIAGMHPQLIGDGHFIADSAAVIGQVSLQANSSVWFNAVIRAENDSISIGENSNIQDGAILHVDPGFPLSIANNVTVGHKAMLHGCTVGEGSLIGINAVVLNGAVIGKRCLIGANALVTENMQVPDGAMVLGSPGKVVKILSEEAQAALFQGANNYVKNSQLFNQSLEPVSRIDCQTDKP